MDFAGRGRRLAGTRKIGHLGTLDPGATGVLPLVIGRATRLAQFFTRNDKTYQGVIHFGYSTDSYDMDGVATSPETPVTPDRQALGFRRQQMGAAQPVELEPVTVNIYELQLLSLEGCEATVLLHCSAGTYVRSIAHDAGQALGCGAFLKSLRRTASGDFNIERARTLEELAALAREGRLPEALIPAAELLPAFPAELVDAITAGHIRNGRDFRVSPFQAREGIRYVKAVTPQGELVAIGEARLPHLYHPVLVL